MAVPTILLTALKRRTLARLVMGIAATLVPVLIMALCGWLAVMALAGQATTACITSGSTSSNTEASADTGAGLSIPSVQGPPITLTAAQVSVARSYIDVGMARNVPDTGLQIAIMMSLQESGLRVLANTSVPRSTDYLHQGIGSDHDSLGTAQQRPSAGWGSVADLMNPAYDAEAFYGGPDGPNHGSPAGLLDVPGWQAMAKGAAAQTVQRSAYPELYAKWEGEATAVVAALKSGASLPPCASDKPTAGTPTLPANLSQERKEIIHYAEEGLGGAYILGRNRLQSLGLLRLRPMGVPADRDPAAPH